MVLSYENNSELGKKSAYDAFYNADKLFAIPRLEKRLEIGIDPVNIPFYGFDSWTHYEVSWLNAKGKPMVAIAELIYPCHSECIIESKSLKLYFNSFNNTQFNSISELEEVIKRDISVRIGAEVMLQVTQLGTKKSIPIMDSFVGESLDGLDVTCTVYTVDPSFLTTEEIEVEEILCSNLLKSNCLVTFQPDWGSLQIQYKGPKINREGLLKYIVSFRNHNEFHEQCIERMFIDIMNHCKPSELTVYGRYTRRGGLDINPYRSTKKEAPVFNNSRLLRQ